MRGVSGFRQPDHRDHALPADDVHHPCHVVGEDMQRHLGGNVGQAFRQEVGRAQAPLIVPMGPRSAHP